VVSSGEADAIHMVMDRKDMPRRAIAITGIPGSGKTTLARGLAEARGWIVLGTGDIARRIDPESLVAGGMANEARFQVAFRAAMDAVDDWSKPLILDGIPRCQEQLVLLPYSTQIIGLTCRADIARDRLLRRGRPDDTPEIVARRVEEQSFLLDVRHADGWLYHVAGWGSVVNTSDKRPGVILRDVLAFLDGTKKQCF
jgi:adenylate kinase family enzyme